MSKRSILLLLSLIAVLAWGGLRLFGRFVAPQSLLAFVAFLFIFSVACTSTFAPIAYLIGSRLLSQRLGFGFGFGSGSYKVSIRHAIRQGALLSLVLVFNLILSALHSWNIFTAVIILAVAVVVEVLSLAHK